MTTQVTTYVCDLTGNVFNTLAEAEECERVEKAIQYICDRVGVTRDVAKAIVTIVGHKPELFIDKSKAQTLRDYSSMKGPINVTVTGRTGAGKTFIHDILIAALSDTHTITESDKTPDYYTIQRKEDS